MEVCVSKRESASHSTLRSRRLKRLAETHEIQIRSLHQRRRFLTRGGVLVGFALAMVVYPIVGTLTPYAGAAQLVPGVQSAQENPSSVYALFGQGPQLVASELPLPDPDAQSQAIAELVNYDVSSYLPGCDSSEKPTGGNGELSTNALCDIGGGNLLRADAAVAFAELNHLFELRFGRPICVDNSYRSLGEQYATKRQQGYLAATPGTSVHGWGLAFDLCGSDDNGATKAWLEDNGSTFGWVNPYWAKRSKWEPWHWEWEPGTIELDVYEGGYWSGDSARPSSSSSSASEPEAADTAAPEPLPEPEPAPVVTPDPEPVVTPAAKPAPAASAAP
jgi:hypothetical protein